MIVPLIPFFLAANITANVGDWKNGPEVVYDARIEYLNYPQYELDKTFVDNITVTFKCRPKTQSCLSCRFHDPMLSSTVLINGKEDKSKVTSKPLVVPKNDRTIFELDFDSHGLRQIVIDLPSVDSFVIGIVRYLADQLNIGADLPSMPTSVFSIKENSTTRQCETNYVISSDRSNNIKQDKKNPYEIVLVPTMTAVRRGEVKGIKKSISTSKCPYRYQYYYDDWVEIGRVLNDRTETPKFTIESEVKSSKTLMTIMVSNYTSHTEDEMFVVDVEKEYPVRSVKKTTVKLYEIVPAEGPLPKINNPIIVNRFWRERQHQ